MPKLNVNLSIGYPGAVRTDVVEIDQNEWDSCNTDEEREDLKNEYMEEWANERIEVWGDVE